MTPDEYPLTGCLGDQAWIELAACVGETALFFGPPSEQPAQRQARELRARSVCAGCGARLACRDAGRRNYEHGIWGGENDEERTLAGFPPRRLVRRSVAAARRVAEARDAS